MRFAGTLAGKYQSKMTASGAGLTGGSSPSVAISTVSAGGDTGRVFEMTDPKGLVSRSYADALGRTTQSIENFVDGAVSDGDDKTTAFTYNSVGMKSLTALLTGGGVQTTEWVYGVATSAINSNDIVSATKWPDPSTGAASSSEQETVTVNALGETLTATDRNGNVHTITYDALGRITSDAVTTLGSGVDGAVRRIETAYDSQGNAYLITSYDAASGGNIVNQVQRAFNGLGQLITEWQAHGGAVNTGTSPKVQYTYSEMASGANHSRLITITYPSGYVLTHNYSSGLNDGISRLSSLSDSSGTVESYDHLGLGMIGRRGHSQPGVDLTYIKQSGESNGDAGDQYTGLDRFGRVVDQRWIKTSTGTATDRFQYGYDRNSNRLWRDNLVNTAFGELYAYDNLNQLTSFDRGTLNGTKTGLTGSASRAQDWDYDALGNWDSLTTDGGSPQARSANAQNEITSISGATTPTYDANGNMTRAETGLRYVYDAWNRLVVVKDSPGTTTLKTHSYDGLNRRVTETASSTTTHAFYSLQWQVLEERVGTNTITRYVWSPVYVDGMIVRERDTDGSGNLDERLWVQHDANWNVTALFDGNGNVVERFAYDPFGKVTILDTSFNIRAGGTSFAWAYLHQGGRYDAATDLYHFRHRDFSPTLGRWISPDPISFASGDQNLYLYTGNSPTNLIDAIGLAARKLKPCEACTVAVFHQAVMKFGHGDWFTMCNSTTIDDNITQKVIDKKVDDFIDKAKEYSNPFAVVGLTLMAGSLKEANGIMIPPILSGDGKTFEIYAKQDTSRSCQGNAGRPPGREVGDLKQLRLVAHELTHVMQSLMLGRKGEEFITDYVNDYLDQYQNHLKANSKNPGDLAYFGNRFEIQAHAIDTAIAVMLSKAKFKKMFNDVCLGCVSMFKDRGLGEYDADPRVKELRNEFLSEYNKQKTALEIKYRK